MAIAHPPTIARRAKTKAQTRDTPVENAQASPTKTTGNARLEARISENLHALLKRAAELQNRSVTDFVVSVVQAEAQKVIEQTELLRFSAEDQARFVASLSSPPAAKPALKRAFARHRKLIASE